MSYFDPHIKKRDRCQSQTIQSEHNFMFFTDTIFGQYKFSSGREGQTLSGRLQKSMWFDEEQGSIAMAVPNIQPMLV